VHGRTDRCRLGPIESRGRLPPESWSGEPLSFTALLVTSFAHVIGEDTSLQAYRKGKSRVVERRRRWRARRASVTSSSIMPWIEFDDVDVAVLVEHVLDGHRVPVPHIVRAANRMCWRFMIEAQSTLWCWTCG
jgi:hypothetical protein